MPAEGSPAATEVSKEKTEVQKVENEENNIEQSQLGEGLFHPTPYLHSY